jgi:hypothetical protein
VNILLNYKFFCKKYRNIIFIDEVFYTNTLDFNTLKITMELFNIQSYAQIEKYLKKYEYKNI